MRMDNFLESCLDDVMRWNDAVNKYPEMGKDVREWHKINFPIYKSEVVELDTAESEDDEIDAVFDVMWTSLNFYFGCEGKFKESFENPQEVVQVNLADAIETAVNGGRIFTVLSLASYQIEDMIGIADECHYDLESMWKIGSASNWAKFAEKETDAEASQLYYAESLGVETEYTFINGVYVLRVVGDQVVNGKEYSDFKIMKCGRVYKGAFVPWQEPDWTEALL